MYVTGREIKFYLSGSILILSHFLWFPWSLQNWFYRIFKVDSIFIVLLALLLKTKKASRLTWLRTKPCQNLHMCNWKPASILHALIQTTHMSKFKSLIACRYCFLKIKYLVSEAVKTWCYAAPMTPEIRKHCKDCIKWLLLLKYYWDECSPPCFYWYNLNVTSFHLKELQVYILFLCRAIWNEN